MTRETTRFFSREYSGHVGQEMRRREIKNPFLQRGSLKGGGETTLSVSSPRRRSFVSRSASLRSNRFLFSLALSNELPLTIAPTVPAGKISYKTLKYIEYPFRAGRRERAVEGNNCRSRKRLGRQGHGESARKQGKNNALDKIDGKNGKFRKSKLWH